MAKDASTVTNPGATFAEVFAIELAHLQEHRSFAHDSEPQQDDVGTRNVESVGASDELETWNTVGLALSGGGIRSATFGLGVLQALDVHHLIHQFDYISTVSGGGYIGGALTSTLQESKGKFVFGGAAVVRDTDAVGQLRNYSNYLLPRDQTAIRNLAEAAAVIGRGLISNAIIAGGIVVILGALTAMIYPTDSAMNTGFIPALLRAAGADLSIGLHGIHDAIPGLHWPGRRFDSTLLLLAIFSSAG